MSYKSTQSGKQILKMANRDVKLREMNIQKYQICVGPQAYCLKVHMKHMDKNVSCWLQ